MMRTIFPRLLKIAVASSARPLVSMNVHAGDYPSDKLGVDATKPGATEPAGIRPAT